MLSIVKPSERGSYELLKRGGDTHAHAPHHLHPPTRVAHLGADLGRQLTKIHYDNNYLNGLKHIILKHVETLGGHISGDMQCFYDSIPIFEFQAHFNELKHKN